MAVIISGRFKKLTCRVRTMFPLEWGAVSASQSRDMDFKPLGLNDTTPIKRMDFGWIPSSTTTDSTTN